jgi:hypothetical protein
MESLAGAEENHRRLLAGLQKSRRDPAIVRTLDSHFEMMASSLKKAGREARYSTPSAFSSKVLSNHAVEVAAIGARWKSQFENVTSWQVIDFQQRMSATQSARVSAVKEQRTRRLSEVAEAMSRIPNGPAALGKVTLEMEVAPGVWWPVIVFTEDGK